MSIAKQKRHRRTGADIKELFTGVVAICDEYDEPISIRHLFYRCANAGLIEKSEKAYNSLRAHLVKWREQRLIPFSWFIDGTRYHYGGNTFNDLGEYIKHCAKSYRLNLWKSSDYYVEVWTEKDAIAAAVSKIAEEWNLRTFVCRGDPSMSSLDAAARTFNHHAERNHRPVILYLGDYDESGLAIPKTIQEKLLSNHDCKVELIRVGINKEHILRFDLPTRPAKGDRRGESIDYAVDIDSMKPADLREILAKEIESFIEGDELVRMKAIEDAERETLEAIDIDSLLAN